MTTIAQLSLAVLQAVPDTIGTRLTVERSWVDTVASVSQGLVSLLVLALLVVGVLALYSLRRSLESLTKLFQSAYDDLAAAAKDTRETAEDIRALTSSGRRPDRDRDADDRGCQRSPAGGDGDRRPAAAAIRCPGGGGAGGGGGFVVSSRGGARGRPGGERGAAHFARPRNGKPGRRAGRSAAGCGRAAANGWGRGPPHPRPRVQHT